METTNEIHDRMLTNVNDEFDKSPGSFIYDVTRPGAIEFETKAQEIETVQSKLDIENLTDDELTRFVYQRTGINRKPATRSSTNVIISGSVGASIANGDVVSTDSVNFISLEDKVIDDTGQMTVFVECEEFGVVGNVPTNSIVNFPVSIQGLVNVYNPEPVVNGYESESDQELKQRYFDKLQKPGKAGNKYHYEEWAKSVTGVGDVRVFPRWNGPLTVKVVVINSNGQPASVDLVQNVFDYIEEERPFGADVTVISAEPVSINLTSTLTIADGYLETDVIQTIKDNISKYLQEIAFKTSFVSYAKIGGLIIESEGVLDYQDLLVNGGTGNISIDVEQIAILGGVNQ